MKHIHLFLSSVVLAFCSCSFEDCSGHKSRSLDQEMVKNEQAKFDEMPYDVVCYVNSISSDNNLRYASVRMQKDLTLKKNVENAFKISGLENVSDNEPELAVLMRLAWTSHDIFLFFATLMEEIVYG